MDNHLRFPPNMLTLNAKTRATRYGFWSLLTAVALGILLAVYVAGYYVSGRHQEPSELPFYHPAFKWGYKWDSVVQFDDLSAFRMYQPAVLAEAKLRGITIMVEYRDPESTYILVD